MWRWRGGRVFVVRNTENAGLSHSRNVDEKYFPGKVSVKFKEGVTEEVATRSLESLGLKVVGGYFKRRVLSVEVPVGDEMAWVQKIKAMDGVEDASRSATARTC